MCTFRPCDSLTASSRTCTANSRVGTSTSACDHAVLRLLLPPEPFENGNRERRRLARARAGLGQYVDAQESPWNQAGLNWRWLEIFGLGQGFEHYGRKRKIFETNAWARFGIRFRQTGTRCGGGRCVKRCCGSRRCVICRCVRLCVRFPGMPRRGVRNRFSHVHLTIQKPYVTSFIFLQV